ncbi:MAG TPA: hypothetical protein VFW00_11005 [Rhodocyclaceae bacterium]|nr:hypothetical protein [Rhodocyclaceae bacterium]
MTITDIAFTSSFVAVLWAGTMLTRYAGISLRRFSIPSVVIVVYILVAYLGILPLYFGWDTERLALGVVDRDIVLMVFVYSSVTLILIIAGFIFAHRYLCPTCDAIGSRRLLATQIGERLVFVALLCISIGMLELYLQKVPSIALLVAKQGGVGAAALARNQMSTTFAGTYWHYRLFFGPLLELSCIFLYVDYRRSRKLASLALFLAAFAFAVFASLMTSEKGPFVELLCALYLSYAISRGGNYWQPAAKYILIFVMVIVAMMYVWFMGVVSVGAGLSQAVFRVFTGQVAPAYFYLAIFPHVHGYLYGASFPNPGGVLPFANFNLPMFVSTYMYPATTKLGLVGTAPTAFWAELYANFGPLGVLTAPFPVGILIYCVHYVLSRFVLTATTVAVHVLVALHLATIALSSLSDYLVDTTLFAILIVMVMALGARPERVRRRDPSLYRQIGPSVAP